MGGQVVLRRAVAVVLLAALALFTSPSAAADNRDDDDLDQPTRLTVGVADDFLGQLAPGGKTLYFVSNRNTATQIFVQNIADGRAWQLFDDGADVTWPRVSPDGRSLLYISFRESASGQLCVRHLPDADGRICLGDVGAALQAEWIDNTRIALVARQSVQGDLRVLSVTVAGALTASPLLERNITSPAISPDGRWLVYIPVARTVQTVGPGFAAHAGQTLEAVPVASAAAATPVKLAVALPGQTGQPAFARDGRSLYVVQFFSDTNHDGAVDASDHGVLVRVPLTFAPEPRLGAPEQLTETSWNCEYPAPFVDRLIATCSVDASLDVYSLPLDGEVPGTWTMPQLANAIDDADTLVEEQMLTNRRLAREASLGNRRSAMLSLVLLHLAREEFRAAQYYAEQIATLRDTSTAGISTPLRLLVEERRAERWREQGRLTEGFRQDAQTRLDNLKPEHAPSPMAEDLIHLVRSEIFDSLGDKGKARAELEAVTVDETTPPPIVREYYRHVDAFYREMDDREALVSACRALAADRALAPDEQLHYARAAVRAAVRGLRYDDADARLVRDRAGVKPEESELLFAIDLGRAVLAIRDTHAPPSVGNALLSLYAAQTRPGRRRALIVDAVQRADDVDADDVLDALVQRDIHDVRRGTHERGEAEDVYERIILARAYERRGAKRFADARTDFEAVAKESGSFEAMAGAIDMGLQLNETPAAIQARYDVVGAAPKDVAFAKAYLITRQLPKLEGEAHERAAADALAVLSAAWSELKEERLAQALFGALLHEQYLLSSDLGTAERANAHYLVALELVGDNPRLQSMILGQLGLLHTDVGNYRIALSYLTDRDKLPYADNAEGLDVLLSKAEALLHASKEEAAATSADEGLAMIARNPMLAKYRLLALDWAALDNLAAGRFGRALALYDEEVPLIDGEPRSAPDGSEGAAGPSASRNQVVIRLARAAAAVGAGEAARALTDLDYVDAKLREPGVLDALQWPHASPAYVERAYKMLASGIRANASRKLGRLDDEARAIEARWVILEERRMEAHRPEMVRDEMLAEAQLAFNAGERRDAPSARLWLGRALGLADQLRGQAHGVRDRDQLDVLRLAAHLTIALHAPLVADLGKRFDSAAAEMASRNEPFLKRYERWFEIYAPLVVGPH